MESKKYYFEELVSPRNIINKGDYLVISESRRINSEMPMIHILDSKSLSYYQSKGVMGFGPGEIPDVFVLDPGFDDSTFWVASGMAKTFSEFNLKDQKQLSNQQIKQEGGFYMTAQMCRTSDKTVVCRMTNDPHQFVEFDMKGNRLKSFGDWKNDPLSKGLNDYMMSELNKGWMSANAKADVFVSVGIYRDRIELLRKDLGAITTIDGPKLTVPRYKLVNGGKGGAALVVDYDEPLSYLDVTVGDQYFYALYCNKNEQKIRKEGDYGARVFVFDFNGNLVNEYELDRSVRAITVNSDRNIIYGITTDEAPGIAVFELP
ncbi:hypothetical protein GCM10028791_21360 [Echinicola sediminis]